MKVNVTTRGEKEIEQALKKMSSDCKRDFKKEVYASGLDVQREARAKLKDMKAWDLGNLANSIDVDLKDGGMTSEIRPTAPYGPYVEHGTKPHFPPPDALEGWAKRHGFSSTWPICKVIAERGLPARPYLFPAWQAVKDKFLNRIKEILKR